MDVTKRLFFATVTTLVISACGGKKSDNDIFSKISGADCTNMVVKNENVLRWKNGKISRLVFKNKSAREKYLNKHKNEILSAEDNYRLSAPRPSSISLLGFPGDLNWGMKTVNAETLWNKNILGQGVVVAIIDSGIDTFHNQLQNQLYTNPNEIPNNNIDDDQNGLVDDIHGYDFIDKSGDLYDNSGHGTHIAGVIAAQHNSGRVTGLAPSSKLLMYDFFKTEIVNGKPQEVGGTIFDAIRGLRAAVQSGAKVINASWGGPGCSTSLKAEIDALSAKEVLFVTAAGNEGKNIDQSPSYPASYSSVNQITVGAMTADDYTAGFSNYGSKVDLMAPGASIISTYPGNQYQVMDGTSMATPFVAGAVALLWSAFPEAKAADIKKALLSSVQSGFYPVKTRGSLDVAAAHAVLEKQFAPPAEAPLP